MARTTNRWILEIYLDKDKTNIIHILIFNNLREIAYCLDRNIYDVSNFYHNITKPKDMFLFINLYKD